jgi:uncharacterized protein (TIGR03067 family)
MRFLLAASLLCCTSGIVRAANAPNGENALAKLNGNWEIKSIERDPPEKAGEGTGIRCTIDNGKLTVFLPGNETPAGVATLKIDATKKPNTISIKPTGEQDSIQAIIQLDGDEMKVCWNSTNAKRAPAEFSAKPGSGQTLVTLKRKKVAAK